MPFEQTSQPDFRCIWVEGPPNSGKSYSIRTCEGPVGIISVPGEKGSASLPYGDGFTVLRWKDDATPQKDRNTLYYMKIAREVDAAAIDMISGKYGKINTLVIDGMHKLYAIYLAIATDGESEKLQSAFESNGKGGMTGEFDPRCYGKSHRLMFEFVSSVGSSTVPWRIFTSWSKSSKDDQTDKSRDAVEHIRPMLPGAAAQQVLGEVSITLHAMVDSKDQRVWQTKPGGKVAGAGIKGPAELVNKIPTLIPQDFKALAKYFEPVEATAKG